MTQKKDPRCVIRETQQGGAVRREKAYVRSSGFVTQTMIDEHGSYAAARAWLDAQYEGPVDDKVVPLPVASVR